MQRQHNTLPLNINTCQFLRWLNLLNIINFYKVTCCDNAYIAIFIFSSIPYRCIVCFAITNCLDFTSTINSVIKNDFSAIYKFDFIAIADFFLNSWIVDEFLWSNPTSTIFSFSDMPYIVTFWYRKLLPSSAFAEYPQPLAATLYKSIGNFHK